MRAVILLAACCMASNAYAQSAGESRLRLTWHAPAGCPDEASVRAAVSALLAQTPEAAQGPALSVDAEIMRAERNRFTLRMVTVGPGADGERRVDADDCAQAADAAALIIALALAPEGFAPGSAATAPGGNPSTGDATAASAPGESTGSSPATGTNDAAVSAAPRSATPPSPPSALDVPPPLTPRIRLGARLDVGLDFGILPAASPSGGLGVSATRRAFRVDLGAHYASEQKLPIPGAPPGATLSVSMFALELRGCTLVGLAYGSVGFCLALDVGTMHGQSNRLLPDGSVFALYAATFAPVVLSFHATSWLSAGAEAAPGVTLVAPTFTVTGSGNVYRPALALARVAFFTEVYF